MSRYPRCTHWRCIACSCDGNHCQLEPLIKNCPNLIIEHKDSGCEKLTRLALLLEIEYLRDSMHAVAAVKGLGHPDTLKASQELDVAITAEQRRRAEQPLVEEFGEQWYIFFHGGAA